MVLKIISPEQKTGLSNLVEQYGLENVLRVLAEITFETAERAGHPDRAKALSAAASAILTTADAASAF